MKNINRSRKQTTLPDVDAKSQPAKNAQGPERSAGTDSETLAEKLVGLYVKAGGELVGMDQAAERMSVCQSCPHIGTVSAPGLSSGVTGCTRCGCFLSVKTRTLRYFSPQKLAIIKATCPEGKWQAVDKKYL